MLRGKHREVVKLCSSRVTLKSLLKKHGCAELGIRTIAQNNRYDHYLEDSHRSASFFLLNGGNTLLRISGKKDRILSQSELGKVSKLVQESKPFINPADLAAKRRFCESYYGSGTKWRSSTTLLETPPITELRVLVEQGYRVNVFQSA